MRRLPAALGPVLLSLATGCAGPADPDAGFTRVGAHLSPPVDGAPLSPDAAEPFLRDLRPAGADATPSGGTSGRFARWAAGREGDPPTLVIADPSGAERRVLAIPGANGEPVLHPDGRRIVFAADVARGRNTDLFLVCDDGTGLVRLTRHEAFDGAPRFTADGSRLAWTTARGGGEPRAVSARLVVEEPQDGLPGICAEDARRHVEILAGADMEGRLAGSLGGQMAASYVADRFRRAGLRPGGDGGAYFQDVGFVREIRPGPGNALTIRIGEESVEARPDVDFRPVRFTKNGLVEADAVAVGYGLVIPGGAEDDYAGWDAAGRAAVALDGVPEGWGEKHPDHRPAASIARKAAAAADRKAAALLVVGELRKDGGPAVAGTAPLPVVRIARAFWDRVLEKAGRRDVTIRVTLRTDMVAVRARTVNVVGIWPGETDETVVLGAHHDHLGYGVPGASVGGVLDRIHPGADDNASGVAGLLEIAQAVAAEGRRFRRALVFAAFAGEELGFVGSGHYVAHPARPLDGTVAMINLDMVGRLKEGGLSLQGVGTSPAWEPLVQRMKAETPFPVTMRRSGLSGSDHSPFLAKRIPVLFFFTGMHKEYHRTSDSADRIDADGIAGVARWARVAAEHAASVPERPPFIDVKPPAPSGRGVARAHLGIVPDYTAEPVGVRVAGVLPGGPAERAGIRSDDLLVRIDDVVLREVDDLLRFLAERKPDEEVEVSVFRNGKTELIRVRLAMPPGGR